MGFAFAQPILRFERTSEARRDIAALFRFRATLLPDLPEIPAPRSGPASCADRPPGSHQMRIRNDPAPVSMPAGIERALFRRVWSVARACYACLRGPGRPSRVHRVAGV